MRYLYGDLSEARVQKDALILLQRVVDMSVDTLLQQAECDLAKLQMQEEKNLLQRLLADTDRFQAGLQQTIQTSFADRPAGDLVVSIGQAVTQTLQQHSKEGKAQLSGQAEARIRELQAKLQQKSAAAFEALRGFFNASGLPTTRRALKCSLEHGAYQAISETEDATGACCTYSLAAGASEFFSAPRRFGDLVAGKHEIPLGIKKGFMKKEPVPDFQRIDDAQLSQVSDKNQACECRLTLRSGEIVALRFDRGPQLGVKLYKIVEHGHPQPVADELLSAEVNGLLARFWAGLEPHIQSLYQVRESLLAIRLGGKDVAESGLSVEVIEALIRYMTPMIQEIDAHSPVPGELSLVVEHEQENKREVFFIRKDALLERIGLLPEAQRKIFAPLGLSVSPGASVRPRRPIVKAPATSPIVEVTREITGEIITGELIKEFENK